MQTNKPQVEKFSLKFNKSEELKMKFNKILPFYNIQAIATGNRITYHFIFKTTIGATKQNIVSPKDIFYTSACL